MKHLVETTGDFMLLDSSTRTSIRHDRPTIVKVTPFVTTRLGTGELKLLIQDLPEEATDDEMFEYIMLAGDAATGVAAYLAHFGLDEYGRPIETEINPKKNDTLKLKS